MNTVVETKPSSTAPKAAWICLALAWICFLVPFPGLGLFIGWPLNLVAFILAIIAMAKRGAMAGVIQLVASLIVSPIVYFVGLAIFAGSLGALSDVAPSNAGAGQSVGAETATEAKASQTEAVSVDARTLYADYDANEIAADRKYKDKPLKVTGVVASIDSNIADEPTVVLTAGDFASVHVDGLPANVAANFAKGQTITVACKGGGEMMGTPLLSECSWSP